MKLTFISELGLVGFSWKCKKFDISPTKFSARIAIGIIAITAVWGNSAAIRGFGV
jgi:hypothetical protein